MTLKRQEYCHRDSRPSQWDRCSGCLTLDQKALPDQSTYYICWDVMASHCSLDSFPRYVAKLKDLLRVVEHDCILSCNCIDQSVGESEQAEGINIRWRERLQCIALEKQIFPPASLHPLWVVCFWRRQFLGRLSKAETLGVELHSNCVPGSSNVIEDIF